MLFYDILVSIDIQLTWNNNMHPNLNPNSTDLICSLKLLGLKERKGSGEFVNFIIPAKTRLEVCIRKNINTLYIIDKTSDKTDLIINNGTLEFIIKLCKTGI